MKIGDRVTYADENSVLPDTAGTVVEPTETEIEDLGRSDMAIGPQHGDVMVAWDDGERYWEQPSDLMRTE